MPPVSGHSTANHQAQRWIDSAVALKPIVQRQNSAPRSKAVPRSTICSISRSPPKRLIARIGGAVHREQQRRAVEEDDREHVERVVEQVAVADRERRGPVEVREDAERHRLAPAAHQDRADEAEHQIEPDRRGEGPGDVRAHAERPRPAVGPQPTTAGSRWSGRSRPSATSRPRSAAADAAGRIRGAGGSSASQGSCRTNCDRIPVHRRPHVEPDDLDRDEAADRATPGRASRGRSARPARRRSCRASSRSRRFPTGPTVRGCSGTPA